MGSQTGKVRIFRAITYTGLGSSSSDTEYQQLGQAICGTEDGEHFGSRVALSSDGSRVAIGADLATVSSKNKAGRVQIYEYTSTGAFPGSMGWVQLGSDIVGEKTREMCGEALSLSSDGSRIAVGSPEYDSGGVDQVGRVRVFELSPATATNPTATWVQVGSDVSVGDNEFDECGSSVALSSDGSVLAVGCSSVGTSVTPGYVRVYRITTSNTYVQIGGTLYGNAAGDRFGRSVSMSMNGEIVAVGNGKEDAGTKGVVRIYKLTNLPNGNSWIPLGNSIEAELTDAYFGSSIQGVSLSGSGHRVAIGAPAPTNDTVSVYELTQLSSTDSSLVWVRLADPISHPQTHYGMKFGKTVSLSHDGYRVGIGSPQFMLPTSGERRGLGTVLELQYSSSGLSHRRRTLQQMQRDSIYQADPVCNQIWESRPPTTSAILQSPPAQSPPPSSPPLRYPVPPSMSPRLPPMQPPPRAGDVPTVPPSPPLQLPPPPNPPDPAALSIAAPPPSPPPPTPRLVVAVSNETLPAPPPDMPLPPPPPDSKAPIITLIGPDEVDVARYEDYVDRGATCVDNVDGAIVVEPPTSLSEVNTAVPTLPELPHVLAYECVDQSGNRAEAQRRVHILDSRCTAASARTGFREHVCPGMSVVSETTPECSVYGVCSDGSAWSSSDLGHALLPAASTPVGTIPPRILLVGMKAGALMARAVDGTLVLQEEVMQGQVYVDPGYVCLDQTGGDITDSVSVFGEAAVDTRRPTVDPFVIRYTCTDLAGIRAEEVQRWIAVTSQCAGGEATCDDGRCPVGGYCIASEPTAFEAAQMLEKLSEDNPPTITLIGDEMIEIDGGGYAKCSEGLAVSALCDRGVTAMDTTDGDLTPYVMACDRNFQSEGLAGCAIHGSDYPGMHDIKFSVTDSAGNEAHVLRKVMILVQCDAGMVRCKDGITCVPEGNPCVMNIGAEIEQAAEPPATAMPPNVTLLGPAVLTLPRFATYTSCASDKLSTDRALCDQGAIAHDDVDGNLTDSLLVCPPESCMPFGCAGHELWRKGVDSCLNTSTPVGTVFSVDFVVFDTDGVHASATRTITIGEPCPEGQYWCPTNSPMGRCERASCEAIEALADAKELPSSLQTSLDFALDGPVINWRTPPRDEMPFGFVYGQTPWKKLGTSSSAASPVAPCTGELANAIFPQCAATARDRVDGDVSFTIKTTNQGDCTPAVLASGLCRPGIHRFFFSAADFDGNIGNGNTAIEIEVLRGWEEIYVTYAKGDCSQVLDPRKRESSSIRSDVASSLALPVGRVRIHTCEQDPALSRRMGGLAARLRVYVVRAFNDGGPLRPEQYSANRRSSPAHPYAAGVDAGALYDFKFHGAEVVGADPNGDWALSMRVKSASLRVDDSAKLVLNITDDVNDVNQNLGDIKKKEDGTFGSLASSFASSFDTGVNDLVARKDEIAAATSDLSELLDKSTQALSVSGRRYPWTPSDDSSALLLAMFGESIDAQCRGANGARHVYYNISSYNMPLHADEIPSPTSADNASSVQDEQERRHEGDIARRLLRDHSLQRRTGSSSEVVIEATLLESSSDKQKSLSPSLEARSDLINYVGYTTRARSFGAASRLRVVGGVLVTQRRTARRAGCRGRTMLGRGRDTSNIRDALTMDSSEANRFEQLYRELQCSILDTGGAFGFDAMFARMDFPSDVTSTSSSGENSFHALYNPALPFVKQAFYNSTEFGDSGLPFAFFERAYDENTVSADVEGALFDVYIDGTLMEDRAKLLLSYLQASRFVDQRTRFVDFRFLLHNVPEEVLADVRVRISIDAHSRISTEADVWKLSLFDYFGTARRAAWFAVELLVAAFAIALCVSSIGDMRQFLHLLHASLIRRLQGRIVRRHFLLDAWTIVVDVLKLAIPLSMLSASIVRFVFFFGHVRNFTYERNYRWYDGDGSAAARILLPKRLAGPQPPLVGYPRGAFRHTMTSDFSDRDAYLQLLDRVDDMHVLSTLYSLLQVPILLGIAANIARQCFSLSMLYPFMLTLRRSLPSIATVVIVLIGFVAGCSYILHLLAGDRVAEYSRVLHAVDKFADFQLDREEGMVKYELSIGRGQGVLIDPMQQFAIMLVHLFYPLLTALTMLKFIFAILFGLFWKERDRRVARERLEKRRRTSDQSLARNLMRNHGHLDQARDLLSALLYNLGWRNASAFVFTGNVKWLDVRRALPGFTSAKNASGRGLLMDDAGTTTPTPISPLSPLSSPAMFGATAAIRERASGGARAILDMHESRSTPIKLGADGMVSPISPSAGRWRRAQKLIRLTERSIHVLEDLLQRRKDYGGLKSHAISTTVDSIDLRRISNRLVTGEMRGKGLLTDSSRYLRMNQVNRQELTVPLLGMRKSASKHP